MIEQKSYEKGWKYNAVKFICEIFMFISLQSYWKNPSDSRHSTELFSYMYLLSGVEKGAFLSNSMEHSYSVITQYAMESRKWERS